MNQGTPVDGRKVLDKAQLPDPPGDERPVCSEQRPGTSKRGAPGLIPWSPSKPGVQMPEACVGKGCWAAFECDDPCAYCQFAAVPIPEPPQQGFCAMYRTVNS